MTKEEKLQKIKERFLKFEYGLGQTDKDIRYLLTLVLGHDPDEEESHLRKLP